MKKLFLTTVGAVCVMISFAQVAANSRSQAQRNNANTMKVYRAIETGDVSNLDDVIDENIVDHDGPSGDIVGRDAVKSMFVDMHDHISNLKMESIANATGGEYHFNLARMTGTTNSDYMGMAANTPIDMTSVNVVRIKNGKAVEHWSYRDPKEMMKMMKPHMDQNASPRTENGATGAMDSTKLP